MNAITIAIANQKGGVAKTTSTICLGGLLSEESNCLAIDLDPQGNLSTGLGIDLPDDSVSCYDIITEQAHATEVIVFTNSGLNLTELNISFFASDEQSINSIRAELMEDRHHRDLTESDYSNDTHDWGDTTYFNSDEYWNFLGRYE